MRKADRNREVDSDRETMRKTRTKETERNSGERKRE